MRIRGTPTIRRTTPQNFTQKFNHTKLFFRDRKSALWRMPLYSLAFISLTEFPGIVGGIYAFTRILTLKKGDPRNWRKAVYFPMLANGFVNLFPLAHPRFAESFVALTSKVGISENKMAPFGGADIPLVQIAYYIGLPILLGTFVGIGRYAYALATSGKVIKKLAESAVAEKSENVASQFLTAKSRMDRRIVLKTMRQIKKSDRGKFMEILEAMQAAEISSQRTQRLLEKLC